MTRVESQQSDSFKYAGFSGPHPSLVVACPACLSPVAHYCNDEDGKPTDRPHDERRSIAMTGKQQHNG